LIDQIVTGIAHQPKAIGQIASDEFGENNDAIQHKSKLEPGGERRGWWIRMRHGF
jgi:hypothetical protein